MPDADATIRRYVTFDASVIVPLAELSASVAWLTVIVVGGDPVKLPVLLLVVDVSIDTSTDSPAPVVLLHVRTSTV